MSDDLVKQYRNLQASLRGCHDSYCVIKKPQGAQTNGGCTCLEDMKLYERSRVGVLLRYGQEMADRNEELEAKLAKAADVLEQCEIMLRLRGHDEVAGIARSTLAELKGEDL